MPDYRLIIAISAFIFLTYAVYCFVFMPRPRGLRIQAPDKSAYTTKSDTNKKEIDSRLFARIDKLNFAKAFGFDFNFKPEPQVKKPPEKIAAKEPEPQVKPETKEVKVNLEKLGYRLKGIIHNQDGSSVAFVYSPVARKTLIVRENATGSIELIKTSLREVKIRTEKGDGILELENVNDLVADKLQQKPGAKAVSLEAIEKRRQLQKKNTSSSHVADMIQAGHFRVQSRKGRYRVKVNRVPDAFAGYGLRQGDEIIGTSQKDFRRSQDIAIELGGLSRRPVPIKIRRGRKTIFLTPKPAEKQKKPTNK